MKRLTCEMCGSNDIIKSKGVFVCQSCGCKYSIADAVKMMIEIKGPVDVSGSTVKLDHTKELANLYQIARQAKSEGNVEKAGKYYDMILVKDPNSWEAAFYSVFYQALDCKIAEISSAATKIKNCLRNVLQQLKANVPKSQHASSVFEIVVQSTAAAELLYESALKHYNGIDYSIQCQYTTELSDRLAAATNIMYECGDAIESVFYDDETVAKIAVNAWKKGMELHNKMLKQFSSATQQYKDSQKNTINAYSKKREKYDISYRIANRTKEIDEKIKNIESEIEKNKRRQNDSEKGGGKTARNMLIGILLIAVGCYWYLICFDFLFAVFAMPGLLIFITGLVGIFTQTKKTHNKCAEYEAQIKELEEQATDLKTLERKYVVLSEKNEKDQIAGIKQVETVEEKIRLKEANRATEKRIADSKAAEEKRIYDKQEAENRKKRIIISASIEFIIIAIILIIINIAIPNSKTINQINALENVNVGSIIKFGFYEQDNHVFDGKEEIEWIVLTIKDDKALIISKYALDCLPFDSSNNAKTTQVYWDQCTLRHWLNSSFFNNAFRARHVELIEATNVAADDTGSDTNPEDTIIDNVFLLSKDEAGKYFKVSKYLTPDDSRVCEPTRYAESQGATEYHGSSHRNCYWWLRSIGYKYEYAAYVDSKGEIDPNGWYIPSDDVGVRPAMWISLEG